MSDLEVGVRLLHYADRIGVIIQQLADVSVTAHAAADLLAGDDGFYDGRARPEMKQFFESYAANVDKLVFFETVAERFLGKAFAAFDFTEKELAQVVAIWMDGGS